jgi:hypothetical protein
MSQDNAQKAPARPVAARSRKSAAPGRQEANGPPAPVYRPCPKCGQDKPRTAEFYPPSSQNQDGLFSYCRDCERARYQDRDRVRMAQRRARGPVVQVRHCPGCDRDLPRAEFRRRHVCVACWESGTGRTVRTEELVRCVRCAGLIWTSRRADHECGEGVEPVAVVAEAQAPRECECGTPRADGRHACERCLEIEELGAWWGRPGL